MINSNFRAMIGYDEILIEISMDKVSIYKYKKIMTQDLKNILVSQNF